MRIFIFLFVLPDEQEEVITDIGVRARQAAQAEHEEIKFLRDTPATHAPENVVLLFEETFFIVREILIYTDLRNNVINLIIFKTTRVTVVIFLFDPVSPVIFFGT